MDKDNLSHADVERLLTELASPAMQENERRARMERARRRACHAARTAINGVFLRRYCVRAAGAAAVLLLLIGVVATLLPMNESPIMAQKQQGAPKTDTENIQIRDRGITANSPTPARGNELPAETAEELAAPTPIMTPTGKERDFGEALAQAHAELEEMLGSLIDGILPAPKANAPAPKLAVVAPCIEAEPDADDAWADEDTYYHLPEEGEKEEFAAEALARGGNPPLIAAENAPVSAAPALPASPPAPQNDLCIKKTAKKARSTADKQRLAKAETDNDAYARRSPAAAPAYNAVLSEPAAQCRFTEAAGQLDGILTMLRTRVKAAHAVKDAATAKTYLSYVGKTVKESRMAEHVLAALNPNEKHDCDFTKRLRARRAEIMTAMTTYAAAEEALLKRLNHADGYGDKTVQKYLKAPSTRELCRQIKATQQALKATPSKK